MVNFSGKIATFFTHIFLQLHVLKKSTIFVNCV